MPAVGSCYNEEFLQQQLWTPGVWLLLPTRVRWYDAEYHVPENFMHLM
jgi:hypothetical protein